MKTIAYHDQVNVLCMTCATEKNFLTTDMQTDLVVSMDPMTEADFITGPVHCDACGNLIKA